MIANIYLIGIPITFILILSAALWAIRGHNHEQSKRRMHNRKYISLKVGTLALILVYSLIWPLSLIGFIIAILCELFTEWTKK